MDPETRAPAGKSCAMASPRSVCFQGRMDTPKVQAQIPWAGFPEPRSRPQDSQRCLLGFCKGGPRGRKGFLLPKVIVVCHMLFFSVHFHKFNLLVPKTDFAHTSLSSKNHISLTTRAASEPRGACAVERLACIHRLASPPQGYRMKDTP